MTKTWERHEQVLDMLSDTTEPSTRQPPSAPGHNLAAGLSEYEERRLDLEKSKMKMWRSVLVFVGITFFLMVFLGAVFGDGDPSQLGKKGTDADVIPPSANTSNFDTLVGLHGVKNAIQQVLRPLPVPGLKPVRGLLMYGPPGCGKTEIAKAAAGHFGYTFISVSCSSIGSPYVGQSAINVRNIFRKARAHQPCIVLFDEVDTLIPSKENSGGSDAASQETSKAVSEFLTEMSQEMGNVNSQVYFFAATNHPKKLDSATLRRFEKKVYVPLPNRDIRAHLLRRAYIRLSKEQINELADLTYGYSSSDLETIEKEVYTLMMEKYKNVDFKGKSVYPDYKLIRQAVMSTPASSSEREIRAFESWSKQYGGAVEKIDPPANRRRPPGGYALTTEQQEIADRLLVADDSFPRLDDIAGLEGIKSVLTSDLYNIMIGGNASSALLYGPAGTGKSTIVKALARYATELGGSNSPRWKVLPISAADINSKYIGQSEKMVDAVFRVAESNQPCIIFMDEIDSLFQDTEGGKGDGTANSVRVKNAFQTIVGELIENPSQIMFIGTTNHPEVFDAPMTRRFLHRLYVPLPTRAARKQIFTRLLNSDTYKYSEKALDQLAANTATWAGSDISAAVAAARTMMRIEVSGQPNGKKENPNNVRQDILAHAIRNHVPANSMDMIKKLRGWDKGQVLDSEEDDVLSKVYNFVERLMGA